MRWTAEMDAELMKRWPNQSASQIAKVIGCTRNAVIGRHGRLIDAYAEYNKLKADQSKAETAAKRVREKEVVDRIVKRFNLRHSKCTQRRKEAIAEALEQGGTQTLLADALGISKQRVSQIVAKIQGIG